MCLNNCFGVLIPVLNCSSCIVRFIPPRQRRQVLVGAVQACGPSCLIASPKHPQDPKAACKKFLGLNNLKTRQDCRTLRLMS